MPRTTPRTMPRREMVSNDLSLTLTPILTLTLTLTLTPTLTREMASNELARREAGRKRLHEEERVRLEPFLRMQLAATDGVVESATPGLTSPDPNPAAYPAAAAVVAAQKGPPAWAC